MAIWSKFPAENATCHQVVHPWTKSCTLCTLDMVKASIIGSSVFYTIHFLFEYLIQKAKNRKGPDDEKKQLFEMCKTFFRSTVLFACLNSSASVGLACLFRNVLGSFQRPAIILIPGTIAGLSIFNQDKKTRQFYSTFFVNSVISIILRRMEKAGTFKLTLATKTCLFMSLSATIAALLISQGSKASHYQFYWFFKPAIKEGNSEKESCYHSNSCASHAFQDFYKYFTTGFLLSLIRVLFRNSKKLLKLPKNLLNSLAKQETYVLPLFFGSYSLIFHTTRCLLRHFEKNNDTTANTEKRIKHNFLAGALAGLSFTINPSSTILNYAFITVVQIISRVSQEKGWIPKWPYVEIAYAICNGILFDSSVIVNDCPNIPEYCINSATNGRSSYYRENFIKYINAQRFKSKRTKLTSKDSNLEDDSDSTNDDYLLAGKGTDVKNSSVSSMRTDLVLKIGLGISRNKIEQAFYDSRVRLNSKKVLKKSTPVQVGDEVDMVKGVSPTNPEFIVVGRVEVLNAIGRDDDEGIDVKIRRSKSLVIENYPDGDPWKHTDSSNS